MAKIQKNKVILLAILVISMVAVFQPTAALALNGDKPCSLSDEKNAIPGTFNVRDCLTIPEQLDSKFVPKERGLGEGVQGPANENQFAAGENENGIVILLVNAIDIFVKLIGSISLILFIFGAGITITAEGKDDRLDRGKNAMLYAIIGLAITFLSFIIVAFVQSVFY